MNLKELQNQLEFFQYNEKAELTKDEIETLKKMFSVKGSFKALFRHFCIIESDKGTQMLYDIEDLPSDGQYTDREIADVVRFKKLTTQFIRGRVEALRNTFEKQTRGQVEEKEKKTLEEREKQAREAKEREIENSGVSPDL